MANGNHYVAEAHVGRGNQPRSTLWFAKTQYNRIGSVPAGLEASNIGNLQYSE
jgi:hypothetical protein